MPLLLGSGTNRRAHKTEVDRGKGPQLNLQLTIPFFPNLDGDLVALTHHRAQLVTLIGNSEDSLLLVLRYAVPRGSIYRNAVTPPSAKC